MQVQTNNPVVAVLVRDVADLQVKHRDHEDRLRPLEKLRAQIGILAFLGSLIGGALVNFLFQR